MLLLLVFLETVPPLPDSSGWGVHVLAIARAPQAMTPHGFSCT
jgi:hypothetical protein